MTINKTQKNGNINIALKGRLDTSPAPELQSVLIPAFDEASQVELDIAKLDYISSAGLRVLLAGHKAAQLKNGSMTVSGVSEGIMEVFSMTGFTEILKIK